MELVILIILGGLSWLANLGLDRLLKRRLRPFEAADVYIIPGFFRQPLLLVAVVLIPLEIVLPLAWLIRPVEGIEIGIGLGLPALLLPLLAFALVMLWIHYGAVLLDGKGVRRLYLIGQREIPYQDIRELDQTMFFLTPVTNLRGCGEQIRFPRGIHHHPELYQRLSEHLKANQEITGEVPSGKGEVIDFPYSFGISSKRMLWEKIAFGLLMLIFAVLATLGLWIQLAQHMLPPFTWESLFLIALFFIPFGIIFPILVVFAYRKTTDPDTPMRFVLYPDRIEVIYPGHHRACYRSTDLQAVRLTPIQSVIKSTYDGATVSDQVTRYALQIDFAGEEIFELDPNRLAMFKETPEHLRMVFRSLYGI